MEEYFAGKYDVAVIGAGHAGVEAALAAARLGVKTCIFTLNLDKIANMPCNPSIGGTAKGHLVREIDALGGEMGKAADKYSLQTRMLNLGKGPAVHSLRAQIDRKAYTALMKHTVELQENLILKQAEVIDLKKCDDGWHCVTRLGAEYVCKTVILATGTFLGGNLTTALQKRTKNGGAVVWGGIRDVEQMKKVPDVQVYYRGIDPTPIREFVMKDWNDITNFGGAVCLPGDIVFGAGGGVLFIPAHLVADVVEGAAKTHVKDDFGFEMICQGKFTTAQIDRNTWSEEMLDMLVEWIKTDPRGEEYRDLDWSKEYDLARNGDPDDTQTAL